MTEQPYGFGPDAYERWLAALESDDIDVHGNWWNASVWGECRAFAAEYFGTAANAGAPPGSMRQRHGAWPNGTRRWRPPCAAPRTGRCRTRSGVT